MILKPDWLSDLGSVSTTDKSWRPLRKQTDKAVVARRPQLLYRTARARRPSIGGWVPCDVDRRLATQSLSERLSNA
jgi:hypothetical protein